MGLAILFSTTGEIAFRGSTTWMSHAEEHWDVSTAPWTKGNTMALRHMRLVGESKRVEADPNEIDRFGRRLDRRSQRCRRAKALSSLLICQSFSKFRSSEGCGAGRFFFLRCEGGPALESRTHGRRRGKEKRFTVVSE